MIGDGDDQRLAFEAQRLSNFSYLAADDRRPGGKDRLLPRLGGIADVAKHLRQQLEQAVQVSASLCAQLRLVLEEGGVARGVRDLLDGLDERPDVGGVLDSDRDRERAGKVGRSGATGERNLRGRQRPTARVEVIVEREPGCTGADGR